MILKRIIEEKDSKPGVIFDWAVHILIICSVIVFTIETLPNLESSTQQLLNIVELTIVVLFSAEYLARIYVADKKWRYIFSFYGIVDFLSVAPYYIALGLDLRSLRIFRLVRLIRLLKLMRYTAALKRFSKALALAKEELIIFGIFTALLLYLAAVGIYFFENPSQPDAFKSVAHSLWWAVSTLTTVGYGDIYPITTGGKVFTFFILMIGLGVVAVPAGILASALNAVKRNQDC